MHAAIAPAPIAPSAKRTRRTAALVQDATPAGLPRMYTMSFVMTMFGVSKRTIQRWQAVDGFPSRKTLAGGIKVFLADEVDAFAIKRLGMKA